MAERFSDEAYARIMARIHTVTGTRTQSELAEVLGVRQASIADAKRRGSIPAEWLLTLLRKLRVNPEWVLGGGEHAFMRVQAETDAARQRALIAEALAMFSTRALADELIRRAQRDIPPAE